MSDTATDPLFDLNLNEEQYIARESLRRFAAAELREKSRPADEAAAAPEGFYNKTMELGLSIMPIPEAYDGAGMPRSPISNMLNAEDLAAGDMSLAMGALSPLGFINAVIDGGTEAQQKAFLSPFIAEEFVPAAVALMEPKATFDPLSPETTATKTADGYQLNGVKAMVPFGSDALYLLVIASVDGTPAAFVVPKGTAGVTAAKAEHMGLRPLDLYTVTLENAEVPADNRLGGEAEFDLNRLVNLSRIGLCAMSVGVCQSVLEYVVEYANDREAFGEPISNRQAVAFMIADIAIELEAMRLATYRAASRAEQGLEFGREAYLAHMLCVERSMEIGTNGVQLLGGHGFCREHIVELWYRNLRAVGILEGATVV